MRFIDVQASSRGRRYVIMATRVGRPTKTKPSRHLSLARMQPETTWNVGLGRTTTSESIEERFWRSFRGFSVKPIPYLAVIVSSILAYRTSVTWDQSSYVELPFCACVSVCSVRKAEIQKLARARPTDRPNSVDAKVWGNRLERIDSGPFSRRPTWRKSEIVFIR